MTKLLRNQAQVESLGQGRFRISGVLDASTVTGILNQSTGWFGSAPQLIVDLAAVTESDSAGLALLLEWLRLARKAGVKIHFDDVPEQIMALARISEVDDLLLENGVSDAESAPAPATAAAATV